MHALGFVSCVISFVFLYGFSLQTIAEDCSLSNDIVSSTPYKSSRLKSESEKEEGELSTTLPEYSFKGISWVEIIEDEERQKSLGQVREEDEDEEPEDEKTSSGKMNVSFEIRLT